MYLTYPGIIHLACVSPLPSFSLTASETGFEKKERKRGKKNNQRSKAIWSLVTPVSIDVKPIRNYWTRGASFFRFICGVKCTVQISRHWDKDPRPPWRLTPAPHHPLKFFRIRNKTLQNDSRLLTGEWNCFDMEIRLFYCHKTLSHMSGACRRDG